MRLLRTMLFVPGNNMRMIHKAPNLDADAFVLDLEDAVPVTEKETARFFVKDSLTLVGSRGGEVFVRVNGLTTGLTAQDLDVVIHEGLHGIMLAKAESKEDIAKVEAIVRELESERNVVQGTVTIIPLLETAKGVLNAYDLAVASNRVIALSFGAVDFTRDLGVTLSEEGTELLYARSRIAVASRAAGIQAIDTPYLDLANKEGLIKDSEQGRDLGFKGKLLIHPRQIDPVNRIFSPDLREIEYAKKVVEAFEEAEAKGLGAVSLERKMIDYASLRQAKELLSFTEAIAEKERNKHV